MNLKAFVRDVQDFPIPGVLFRDISPLLQDPHAFDAALEALASQIELSHVDAFVGIESRGFILGAALAAKFKKGFIPLRKAGKLPPPVQSSTYQLEYGTATLEMKSGTGRVAIVDDVLATGGTLASAIDLCERSGFVVEAALVLISLKTLNQMTFRGREIPSVLAY